MQHGETLAIHADHGESPTLPYPIVAIGASAGGLEAFVEFVEALPEDTGMAFVLLLHLPADYHTQLPQILGRVSRMPIEEVRDRTPLQSNHVYVGPADSDLELQNGALILTPRRDASGGRRPIDRFFESLAQYQGARAIAVVLSGTASDGSVGIEAIKAAGGITIAQDDTAQHDSMPRSAVATGAVDLVLSPADIAHELARISKHPLVSTDEAGGEQTSIEPVLEALRARVGVDFSRYKPATLARRIARRIVLHKLDDHAAYLKMLNTDPAEAEALYQDILINVTSFFRNPEAFDALKAQVFPALTANRSRHDPLRIWTLGCSTGEEAYSISMALSEYLEDADITVPVQVFATDLNATSIDRARLGMYPKSAVEHISEERLARFFHRVDGSYRITKAIRDTCVFARHNVLTDPPFSRVDLVTCRNMLIYLGTELQDHVMPILHYALQPDGFLWLGSSETIGTHRDLFELRDARAKIYAKVGSTRGVQVSTEPRSAGFITAARLPEVLPPPRDSQREADRLLLARYAPPSVLIRSDLEILQYRGNTSDYLGPTPGRASLNLLKMVREGLAMGVRSAVEEAKATELPVRRGGLWLTDRVPQRQVALEVIPVRSGTERAELFMVIFEEEIAQPVRSDAQPTALTTAGSDEIAKLRQELSATREYLQSVIEQQEAANEELQAANEEVQSTNEELQSINEEIETSKEEVQSSNEELATVNDELHARNDELAQANNDFLNLLSSVQIAIVMLGPDLRIRRFTPMAEKLLSLIPADIGRPLSNIKMKLDVPDIDTLVTQAMESMVGYEREVRDQEGHWFLLRIRPYRTLDNRLDGAVVVLFDVDSLKRSQEMLRQQTELLDRAHEPIIMWELDGDITYWNKAAEETYGFTREQAIGRRVHELLLIDPEYETFAPALRDRALWTGEFVHRRRDGKKISVESHMVVVKDTEGRALVVEVNRPATQRTDSEGRILRGRGDDLVTADRRKDEFLAMLAHELRNPLAPLRNVVPLLRAEHATPGDRARVLNIMERQIHKMARLIDDLLDVSRISLSQIELRTEPVDISALARGVAEQTKAQFASCEQSLHVSLPLEPVHVNADAIRLEQILGNLLDNASKHTPKGGNVWLAIEVVDASPRDRTVVVTVRDDGGGIDSGKLPHVFDMFTHAPQSLDQEYGGLGIGLTLVRRLVELHGGTVEPASDGPGKGSTFTVRLAALPSQIDRAPPIVERRTSGPILRRVLIVDDNEDNAVTLALALRAAEQEVETADSGERALEIAEYFKPDVVIIDIGMPGMDGYELARRLRAFPDEADARMIALSGYSHDNARQRAWDVGFDDYLVKPVEIARLLELVEG
jgi:two-component system CheB/CheR fusion protein